MRKMRFTGAVGVLATVGAIAFASSAAAAPITGSVSDPQDAPIDAQTNTRAADARAVSVSYDADLGELILTTDLWVPVFETPYRRTST